MATQQVNSQIQITQQTQTVPVYESCLLVSRHKLLPAQENDINAVCKQVTRTDMLPTDANELKKYVEQYTAIIGVIPLPLQVQLKQLGKEVILFYMESVGTVSTKQEAEQLLAKAGGQGVILPPAKEGEVYRVSMYKGLLKVKEIKVEDEFIIKH